MNTHDWFDEENKDNITAVDDPQSGIPHCRRLYHSQVCRPPAHLLHSTHPVLPYPYFKKDGAYQPFPVEARGFFYYHAPQTCPQWAGGLRFRITPRGLPSSFPDGHDLLHEGLPWAVPSRASPPPSAGRRPAPAAAKRRARHTGDLDKCLALTPNKKRLDSKITLYRLGQPFPVAFHHGLHVWVVGETEVKPWTYTYMFADNRAQYRPLVRPIRSRQFELSTLPEHAGTDTVVMRIVKMLTAPTCVLPDYDNTIPAPVEGELVRRPMGKARSSRLQPWYCDVVARAVRLRRSAAHACRGS
ncbi:hypothetical protein B0H13DRAFT_1610166 [Mycena leptocephala]|nr:hypothetical protein B0H13DRAFT_1610166 [Mycena leptocephala]